MVNNLNQPELLRRLANAWITRANTQKLPNKSVKRDKACLEYICGAAEVVIILQVPDVNLVGMAFAVSVRDAGELERYAAPDPEVRTDA